VIIIRSLNKATFSHNATSERLILRAFDNFIILLQTYFSKTKRHMKKYFLSSILFILAGVTGYSQVNIFWQQRYSGSGNNQDKANAMVIDKAGNSYVTGTGYGTSGTFDYLTVKYNSSGVFQWKAEYNGTGNGLDEARSIAIDTLGNIYVTGWSNAGAHYDIVTVKYNAAGTQKWATTFNGATNGLDDGYVVLYDKTGYVYVVGGSDSSATTGEDYITIKYDTLGVKKWHRRYTFSGNNPDAAYAATLDATGNIYVTGYSYGGAATDYDFATVKYNTNGVLQWSSRYNFASVNGYEEARAIAVDLTGNVFVTGYSRGTGISSSNYDYATIKIAAAGGPAVWASRYDGPAKDYDRANALVIDNKGYIYVTGRSKQGAASAEDIVTIKYQDSSGVGARKWLKIYDGGVIGYDEGRALEQDAGKNIYITGYSFGGTAKGNDFATIKYDSTGTLKWLIKYNGTASNIDQASAVHVNAGGDVYVAGSSQGTGTNFDFETIKYCQFTTTGTPDVEICKGQSTTLNATSVGGVSYTWTPSAGLSATNIANPIANPTITTTYIVTGRNAGNCADDDTITVTVNPLPVISITADGPTTFCAGDSVILTSVSVLKRTWSTTDTTLKITVKIAGTYSVTVVDTNGCSNTATQVIVVNPNPVPAVTQNFATLTTGAYASYQWYLGGNLISGATSQNYVPTINGNYKVCVTDGNGCSGCSADIAVTNVGINDIDNISFLGIYPNPNSGEFSIELTLSKVSDVKIKLFNITGQLIYGEDLNQYKGSYKKDLDLSAHAKGVYYLQLVTDKGVLNERIIVK